MWYKDFLDSKEKINGARQTKTMKIRKVLDTDQINITRYRSKLKIEKEIKENSHIVKKS